MEDLELDRSPMIFSIPSLEPSLIGLEMSGEGHLLPFSPSTWWGEVHVKKSRKVRKKGLCAQIPVS